MNWIQQLLEDERTWKDHPDAEEVEMPTRPDGWSFAVERRRSSVRVNRERVCHVCGTPVPVEACGRTCHDCLDRMSNRMLNEELREYLFDKIAEMAVEQASDLEIERKIDPEQKKVRRRVFVDQKEKLRHWVIRLKKKDKTVAEIVEITGASKGTVKRILNRHWFKCSK